MEKRLLVLLFSLASLALVACGGGNDVASSGASAVSAAAPASNASPASAPSTPATTPTEPKINGQIDERTGVAPVAAQMTHWTPTDNGGCGNSSSYKGSGPALTKDQRMACIIALTIAKNSQTCIDMGGLYIPITLPSSLPACVALGGNWGYGMEGGLTLEYCSSIGGFTVGSNPSTALCYYPGGCNLPAFRDYPECK